jgi:hypothetical protein
MEPGTAELREAVFKLRSNESGRVDADFVLTFRTPEGIERWDFGWNLQDVSLSGLHGPPRELFDDFMRSLFEDHMYDLARRGLRPDRGYDELPVTIEIPDEILRRIA